MFKYNKPELKTIQVFLHWKDKVAIILYFS